jgi:hypothetical protein
VEIAKWIVDKYFYIVVLFIIIFAIIEIKQSFRDRKKLRAFMLIIIFFAVVAMPAYDMIAPVVVEKQEFSTAKGNIRYSNGASGNMILETEKDIEEPIDLRIKDDWRRLVYLTDYDIKGKKEVFINYEFSNNDAVNKSVAQNGLVFTYKTRKWR